MSNDPLYIEIADHIAEKIIRAEILENTSFHNPKTWAEQTGLNNHAVEKAFTLLKEVGVLVNDGLYYKTAVQAVHQAIRYRVEKLFQEEITDVYALLKLLKIEPETLKDSYTQYLHSNT